ncbi:zona pellucida sperm-binding protein 3 isoform X2 [Brienomyrus brachyistius]|uniref:zona pellucida sperm-binding protein 3 isoform X2 n=1 Tax=Brienomyrus brachyistius TaxID=42636 RepID=UPI0020B45882|nr:zona pellucida sperm-binding protein 3 isoform X2 [Brienomyrus brachyistius]
MDFWLLADWAFAVRSPGTSVTDSAGRRLGLGPSLWPGFRIPSPVSKRVPPGRFVFLPGVHITCSSSEVVVSVKKRLSSDTKRLRLGRSCVSNGADRLSGDLLFRYPVTACDVVRELGPAHILYRFVLRYSSQKAGVLRHRLECRLNRYHHVHQLAVKPTWRTATSKVLRNQLGGYQIQQMNADWTAPRTSSTYFLGQKVNLRASADFIPAGGKLYVDYCYATASEVPWSTPSHMVVGNFGCMVETTGIFETRSCGRVSFSFRAFQLSHGPSAQVFLHCRLFVMAGDPSATAKSCSYNQQEGRWQDLTGPDSVCDCCDSNCNPSKGKNQMFEGFHSSGLFVFSKKSRSLGTIPASNMSSRLTTLDVTDKSNTSSDDDLVWQNNYEDKGKEKVEILLNKDLNPAEVSRERQEASFLRALMPPQRLEGSVDVSCGPISSSGLLDKLAPSSVKGGVEDDYSNYGLVSGVGEVMFLSDY